MKHIIIGTAGHIDHGKTTLIKAITGRETDRLQEEKERGISIELGFTYFDLPSGQRAGIIDVPGHERFIKNMLAGVIGMDMVLLVVAADEGVMPQTSEHLAILDILGIQKGFIVITKADLVDEEWLELVKEDIKEKVNDTFLENTPMIAVSSTEKTGIQDVVNLIDKLSLEVKDREIHDMPRLPIDRVFSMSGFGTIVTGTLLSGEFNIGEEVQIFPRDKIARIRSLQVHDEDTKVAYAGQRVAMNIAGLKKGEIHRGDVIAPKDSMKKTLMLDVKIKLIKSISRPIENRTRLRLYIGTKEVLCRIVLLDKDVLNPGEDGYAQLRLEEEVVAKRGDKFIVRFYSPMYTIGGGEILEPNPDKKKRFDENAIKELQIKEKGNHKDIIEKIILDKSKMFPTIRDISKLTAMLQERIEREVENLSKDGKIILFKFIKDLHIIHINYFNELKTIIIQELKEFHKKNTLKIGMEKEVIRSKYLKNIKPNVAERFIQLLIEKGYIEQHAENISIRGFQIQYSPIQLEIKNNLLKLYFRSMFAPPKREELPEILDYDIDKLVQVFDSLVNSGEMIKLNDEIYLHKSNYEKGLKMLKDFIKTNESITVAEYRDILKANRKVALSLLEYFDQKKITIRDQDRRILI